MVLSQSVTPSLSPACLHKSVLCICVSIPALQIVSPVTEVPLLKLDFGAWDYARDLPVSAKLPQWCSTLCDSIWYATRLLCPWDSPGKNTGVGCYWLLQGIFLTQGSNPRVLGLLHWQTGSLSLAPAGKPRDITAISAMFAFCSLCLSRHVCVFSWKTTLR